MPKRKDNRKRGLQPDGPDWNIIISNIPIWLNEAFLPPCKLCEKVSLPCRHQHNSISGRRLYQPQLSNSAIPSTRRSFAPNLWYGWWKIEDTGGTVDLRVGRHCYEDEMNIR